MTWFYSPMSGPAFRRSRESYGAERVHHELAENGIEVGRHRVARLMRGNGLSPKRKQKFKKTTDSQHNKAVASNLLDQNFSAEAPNEKWAADISYIWTAQGWLYLAVMLDLYSRARHRLGRGRSHDQRPAAQGA